MPWVRFDDSFYDHPKFEGVSDAAFRLWACAIGFCGRHLTNGIIFHESLRKISRHSHVKKVLNELVNAGLLEEIEGGYRVHDYLEYNPSREQIVKERKENAKRQADFKVRHKPGSNAVSNGVSNGVTNSAPSRPVPLVTKVTNTEDPPHAAVAAAEPEPKRQVPKEKGPSLSPLADAFRSLGLPNPVFIRGEARAAQELLKAKYTPEEIARCWQDFATGEYEADGFSRRDLSFDFLANRNRVGNWKRWLDAGKPRAGGRNGKSGNDPGEHDPTGGWPQQVSPTLGRGQPGQPAP